MQPRPNLRRLKSIINRFDAGPLSLLELSRIAVRRAIGDTDFKRRVRALSERVPPRLLTYIADSTELMLSDAQVRELEDQTIAVSKAL